GHRPPLGDGPEAGEGVPPGGRLQRQVPPIPGDVILGDPCPGRAPAHGGVPHDYPSASSGCLAGDPTAGGVMRPSILNFIAPYPITRPSPKRLTSSPLSVYPPAARRHLGT